MNHNLMINLARVALLVTFFVVVLGAYVRLSDAGLGCPDWPGCYGKLIVPEDAVDLADLYPERPLEHGKAWKEMIHRYAAGTLGILIFSLAVLSWQRRKLHHAQPVVLPSLLVVLVIFQALLGMWTVTLLLKPVIVMAHLLGGLTILSLLLWLNLNLAQKRQPVDLNAARLRPWAIAATVMLVLQISLGGWTSANYAALACPDFPTCQGEWWPQMDFREGFVFWRGLGIDYEGGVLHGDARAAIHMSHRIGAILTTLIAGAAGVSALLDANRGIKRIGVVILILLCAQIALGIANVMLRLPLPVAVAHNGVAALLLLSLVALLHQSVMSGFRR